MRVVFIAVLVCVLPGCGTKSSNSKSPISKSPNSASVSPAANDASDLWCPGTVAISDDGSTIATSTGLAEPVIVEIWQTASMKKVASRELSDFTGVLSIRLSPDGSLLAVGQTKRWLLLKREGAKLKTLIRSSELGKKELRYCGAFAFSADGKVFACGGFGVSVWDTKTASMIGQIDLPGRSVQAVSFGKSVDTMALASVKPPDTVAEVHLPCIVEIWNWRKQTKEWQLPASTWDINHLVWSPTALIAAGFNLHPRYEAEIAVWDVKTRKSLRRIRLDRTKVVSLVLSKDGASLAGANDEGGITVWNTKTWNRVLEVEGSSKKGLALSFGLSETELSSTSGKEVLEVFDIKSKRKRVSRFAK